MGAAASTQLATEFFEDSRRGCPPIHLDMNMDTKKVTDEGIKLMPGGALIVPSVESPLQQIGDGKGVSGKLRTVDNSRPSKLMSSSRFISQKARTQKAPEGKPLAKSAKEASDLPGQTATLAESEVSPDLKSLFVIEQEAKPQEIYKNVISSSPESSFGSKNKPMADEFAVKLDGHVESNPLLENYTLTPVMVQANPSVVNQVPAPYLKEVGVPLANDASKKPPVFPCQPPLNREIVNPTPLFKDIGMDSNNPTPLFKDIGMDSNNPTPLFKDIGMDSNNPPNFKDFDMDNAIRPADRARPAEQSSLLSNKDRITSSIPAVASDARWNESAKQAFYSSMLRKGWIFKESDMTSENMKNMLKIHSANHELAWREVLKWEALHADECKEPKLKSCSAVGTKYSPRARIRSWIGYSLPFDRHDWIIDRNGKEVRYIIDYYDGGKFNANFEFALLDVRPALDSFEALWDRLSVAIWKWTSDPGSSAVPGSSQVSVTSSVSEPLNIGERLGGKTAESLKGQNTSRFMSYNLSDVEREREKKNSVG